MKRISIKGVVLGGIADIVATNLLTIPLVVYVARQIDLAQFPPNQMSHMIMLHIHTTPVLYSVQAAIGIASSVFGGYLAAWLARHDQLLNGALSSWLCITFGLYGLASGAVEASTTMQVVGLVVSPLAGAIGGYVRLRQTAARLERG
ncbi:MAG TPA: hypothetical protein VKA50_04735 [Gammaproteobacteria bacterium]|nr:hypothetical protein [Gammaproteobacteria bacterium]